jgi:hypothetical protein
VGTLFEWLKRFGFFTYIAGNVNIFVAGDRAGGTRGRPAQRLLLPAPAARPTLQIHLATNRRERPSDILLESGNRERVRAGWKTVIKGLDDPRKGNR